MLCMHIITKAARHGHIQQLFIQTIRAIDPRACRVGSRRVSEVGFIIRKKNGYGCSFALRTDIRQISAAGPGAGEEGNSWPLEPNAKIPRSSNERLTNVCHIDTILHLLLLITSTYSHSLCTFSSTYVGYTNSSHGSTIRTSMRKSKGGLVAHRGPGEMGGGMRIGKPAPRDRE